MSNLYLLVPRRVAVLRGLTVVGYSINTFSSKSQINSKYRFRSLTTAFFRDAMGFILIFDLTSEQSLNNIRNWISQLQVHSYCENPDIILCGNKSDLTKSRQVSEESINRIIEEYGLQYYETSALTGKNIDSVFTKILDKIMFRMEKSMENKYMNLPNSVTHTLSPSSSSNLTPITKINNCGC
ncbi:hypothetical protein A3Q56_03364 [Intoshia linei]|uniref:Ras-related protein Rab-27A n=1 Tax=Intoshia linei TaxID=1819745 RepID=A0A177B422_9BILA|nr:hypothetical protein A3Q56_03364 [Intoshia linei]